MERKYILIYWEEDENEWGVVHIENKDIKNEFNGHGFNLYEAIVFATNYAKEKSLPVYSELEGGLYKITKP